MKPGRNDTHDGRTPPTAADRHASLGVHSRLGDWLDHPTGGPLLVAALLPDGGTAAQLDMIRGLTLRRLVATSQGALSQAAAAQIVLQVAGTVLEDDDFDEPAAPGLTHGELIDLHPPPRAHRRRGPHDPRPSRCRRCSGIRPDRPCKGRIRVDSWRGIRHG